MKEINGKIILHWELVLIAEEAEDFILGKPILMLREVSHKTHKGVFEAPDKDAATDHCVIVLGVPLHSLQT